MTSLCAQGDILIERVVQLLAIVSDRRCDFASRLVPLFPAYAKQLHSISRALGLIALQSQDDPTGHSVRSVIASAS